MPYCGPSSVGPPPAHGAVRRSFGPSIMRLEPFVLRAYNLVYTADEKQMLSIGDDDDVCHMVLMAAPAAERSIPLRSDAAHSI